MPGLGKTETLAGRKAVGAYRTAHARMHSKPWHKGIPEEHSPLLNALKERLAKIGFNSLQEFFDASDALEDGWK